jgi:hypothetical protein
MTKTDLLDEENNEDNLIVAHYKKIMTKMKKNKWNEEELFGEFMVSLKREFGFST